MNYKDFYVLSDNHSHGALNLFPKLHKDVDVDKLFRNEYFLEGKIEFGINTGSKIFDFLNSGFPGVFVVSQKVTDLLRQSYVTGWDIVPVHIQSIETLNYFLFTVTGRCGPIDYSRSEVFMKQPYTPTGKPVEAKRGLFFDLNSWDGSDIFTPENSRFTFITEKVKDILFKSKATNLILENVAKFEVL